MPDSPVSQPALSPEEWAAFAKKGHCDRLDYFDAPILAGGSSWVIDGYYDEQQRHALAALCLYQQPFGFTAEDVSLLRNTAAIFRKSAIESAAGAVAPDDEAAALAQAFIRSLGEPYESLASRIASLLPPTP